MSKKLRRQQRAAERLPERYERVLHEHGVQSDYELMQLQSIRHERRVLYERSGAWAEFSDDSVNEHVVESGGALAQFDGQLDALRMRFEQWLAPAGSDG